MIEGYFSNPRPELLPLVPKQARRVLELGCGDGAFARAFLSEVDEKDCEYWGVEASESAARIAASHFKVLAKGIDQALSELPGNHFDLLICNDVLEHLPDPTRTLESLRAKLAPRAKLFLSVPNVRFLPVLLELLLKKDWRYQDAGVLDRTHLRFFTEKSLRRMIEESGFVVKELRGINSRANLLFHVGNVLSLGLLRDTQFPQFAALAELAPGPGTVSKTTQPTRETISL